MNYRRWEESGYGLVEMLVAISIFAVVMTLAATAISHFWRVQSFSGAAAEVLMDISDAQVRAQSEVRAYKINFNTTGESYQVSRYKGPGVGDYEVVETRLLKEGVDLVTAEFFEVGAPGPELFFLPRGISSGGSLVLRSRDLGRQRSITVSELTSRVRMS
ncbi:MAG: prepilin-type N-terminal cleavage/methylation domain-containing protein [Actinomycetota bacterium]